MARDVYGAMSTMVVNKIELSELDNKLRKY